MRAVSVLLLATGLLLSSVAAQNGTFTIRMRYPSTSAQTFGIRGEGAALPGGWNVELALRRASADLWQIKLAFPIASANTPIAFKVSCCRVH